MGNSSPLTWRKAVRSRFPFFLRGDGASEVGQAEGGTQPFPVLFLVGEVQGQAG